MRQSAITNDEVHNARFLRGFLARYPDAKAASRAACDYADMDQYGQAWWVYIAAQCAVVHAGTIRQPRGQR